MSPDPLPAEGSQPITNIPALRAGIERARSAAQRLQGRSVDDVLAVIDRVVEGWLMPDGPLQAPAVQRLAAATGFSPAMIRHGLPLQLGPLRGAAIGALLDAELGSRCVVDANYEGRRARAPGLIVHVLSGNLPALAVAPVLLSLALKSAVLVKPAAGDPLFASLLRASIAALDPALADCVLIGGWVGGDRRIEEVAFEAADVVVASGSDAAITAIAPLVRGRFIGYGHRVSMALIGRESLATGAGAATVAQKLAYDISLWDQQGCLSPQVCYVERVGTVEGGELARLLATRLQQYAQELPPRRRSFAEEAAILRFRQEAEWRPATRLLAPAGSTAWSISLETDPSFVPSCLNRCIRLKEIDQLGDVLPLIEPHARLLEAAGLAVAAEREADLHARLAAVGVHRLCGLGTMQTPSLAWRQGGRPRVADWVTWDEG